MQAPGFWDDQERAASVSAEHASLARRLETFRSLESDIDDLETLEELAEEDQSIASELDGQRASVESRLAELEEARLFSGEYDAGDALVTVNAGAGGTDSQDWAEMLLRMEMRWAERRGMKVEIKEASEGEETAMKMLKAKLIEREERRRQEEIAKEKGDAQDVGWGSQIRSYVLHPYTMVKDHRTNVEVGNAQGVLDGDLDEFVRAELLRRAGNGAAAA
jgi:protein subunit release factor A